MKRAPSRAKPQLLDAMDRFRRAQRVTLETLAARHGCSVPWLSRVLHGEVPVSADEVRMLRQEVAILAREQLLEGAQK